MSDTRLAASQAAGTSQTITEDATDQPQGAPVLHLRLKKPQKSRGVQWTTDTVDNEGMGKKKSKSCCIYEKPRVFGEWGSDSSSSDSDCDGNHGNGYDGPTHSHKKKSHKHKHGHDHHHHDHHHQAKDSEAQRQGQSEAG